MELGLVGLPLSTRARPLAETFEEIARRVELADQLGFTEVFIGEHHTSWNMPVSAPLSFLAALISRTTRIRLGAGVVALPYHHPAAVAGEVAQLDQLSGGRVNLGVGPGGLIPDMELFGVLDAPERLRSLSDSLEAILDLWRVNAPFQIATEQRTFGVTEHANAELRLGNVLRPLQLPHPPIFVTAMSRNSASLSRAVQRGWNPISAHFCSRETLRSHGEQLRLSALEHGVEPPHSQWRVARHIVVRPSLAEAEDAVFADDSLTRFAVEYMWQLLVAGELTDVMKPDHSRADGDVSVDAMLRDLVIFGSPEQVVERIRALRDDVGSFGTLLVPITEGSDAQNAGERQTLRHLASDVAPRL